MDHADHTARLEWLLSQLVGAECFSSIVGEAEDYAVVLHIGERQRRSLRLANPRLSFLQRTYEGSMGFLVECPWRIEHPDGVAATCFDPRGEAQAGTQAVEALVGQTVQHVEVLDPGYDLVLRMSQGWVLRAFCLETDRVAAPPPKEAEQAAARRFVPPPPAKSARRRNWSVWTPEGTWVVGPRGGLEPEPAEEGAAPRSPLVGVDDGLSNLVGWRARQERERGSNDE